MTSTIARLRAEHDGASAGTVQAVLLHEIGVLEERLGDEAASARDQLGAVNAEPDFREPLERLIAIIERRQSYKNLGKLLERLVRVAERPEERSRALLDQAFYLCDHEEDFGGARTLLEQATEECPNDASLFLALELIAGRLGDPELRERAVAARARLTEHAFWKALLLIDLAELRRSLENFAGAEQALDEAIALGSPATFLALSALAELADKTQAAALGARAQLRMAELIGESLTDTVLGDAFGVPSYRRTAAHAADAWLSSAELTRASGEGARAIELLEQALQRLPGDPTLLRARLHAAETAGDTATAARLAQAEIARGSKGPGAAALWIRIAEAAAAEGDRVLALDAVSHALSEDPTSVAARALHLDLLSTSPDPLAFAAALEATAEQLESDSAKARHYLVSADVWARQAKDAQGARAALSQAGMFGAAPWLVARVARMLASLIGDTAWYEEATRRLSAQGANEAEQSGLWFELVRGRALRGELAAAAQACDALAQAPGGAWLGNVLSAYALRPSAQAPTTQSEDTPRSAEPSAALRALSEQESDGLTARALRVVITLRALMRDDVPAAVRELVELNQSEPGDLVVARSLASLLGESGDVKRAAAVLTACAADTSDSALGRALELEAGILLWRVGDRQAAVERFDGTHAGSDTALLGWALSAAEPEDFSARRRAIESRADSALDLASLERFALEAGRGGDVAIARSSLDAVSPGAVHGILRGALLARALWSPGNNNEEQRAEALVQLSELGPGSAALFSGAKYAIDLAQNEQPAVLVQSARRFAQADDGLPAALEWLAAAVQARDRPEEIRARRAVADRLPEPLGAAMRASSALVGWVSGEGAGQPITMAAPAVALANLELAPPGCDPRRRARALLEVGGAHGDDGIGLMTALAGYNQLAAGDAPGAFHSFRQVVEAHPEELMGWEGLRSAAELVGDRGALAEACAALGDALHDAATGAAFWEQAALILLDEFKDTTRGEFALSRAVERDVRRFTAFDRLFRMVRDRKDGPRLLELIARRLDVADDPEEIIKLFWERSRVLRGAGDREGALSALENVRMLEPDHVGALALSGEIYIKLGRFAEAAENLARLAGHEQAPAQQRLMSGVAAVDLYESKLDDVYAALDVLAGLHQAGLSTLPVRERLARAAARAESWDQATQVLELLMNERDSAAGRVEAARLAMVIHRDRLGNKARAEAAVSKLLAELPDDGEALDLVLSDVLPKAHANQLLERGLERTLRVLARDPLDVERVERASRMAAFLGKAALRQATLGVLVALGVSSPAVEQELTRLDQRVAHVPRIAIEEAALPNLADPADSGPIGDLLKALATTICAALGPSLAALGVGKRERVDARMGLPVRNEIAAWAGALGIGEFELYIGGSDPDAVSVIPTETPAIVIGSAVAAPLNARHRGAIARELFALRRGTTVLRHREATEIGALVVAACRLVEVQVPSPQYAMLDEFTRQLGKEIPRRIRKQLPELAAAVANLAPDPLAWSHAAKSSLDRMAVIAAADVSWVLADRGNPRGNLGVTDEARERAQRLLAFVLSTSYLELRDKLGMGLR
ncbi:MAG TPA: tetratricopeptide repeat protein [Polyangiaceae bacterium]